MPPGIKTEDIAKKFFLHAVNGIADIEWLKTVRVSYEDFERSMRKDNFIRSDPTIRGAWKSLQAEDIIFPQKTIRGEKYAVVHLERLAEFSPALEMMRRQYIKKQKQTNRRPPTGRWTHDRQEHF